MRRFSLSQSLVHGSGRCRAAISSLQQLLDDRKGNIATTAAIALVPILAAVAGTIDYAMTLKKATEVQNALDATALALAAEYGNGRSDASLTGLSERMFASHFQDPDLAEGTFSYSRSTDRDGGDLFEVRASFTHAGILGWDFWKAERRAVARAAAGPDACMLALHATASSAIRMSGTMDIRLNGCLMAANSNASDAIVRSGAANLEAHCAVTVGATQGLDLRTQLACGAPRHRSRPVADPLAEVEPPPFAACKQVPSANPKTLEPGTYCNQTIGGSVALSPGIYILRGGQISLGGGGSLRGAGVTIFLMEGARIDIGANQVLELSAPESGPYAGITIFQARNNGTELRLQGGSGTTLKGFVYAPAAHVVYRGNSSMLGAGECIRIVARTLDLAGTSSFASTCGTALGGRSIAAGPSMPILVR